MHPLPLQALCGNTTRFCDGRETERHHPNVEVSPRQKQSSAPPPPATPPQEHFRRTMHLVKMPGDGNCLFHALAHQTGESGLRLREEMAQFLETAAPERGDYEDDWRAESEYLREDPTHWGGDTVIIAYTLLRRRRVTLHWPAADGHIHSDDRTHMQVTDELEEEGQDAIHLYDNR